MAKSQRIFPNRETMTVQVFAPANRLRAEEKAELSMLISAGYVPDFQPRPQTDKQKARTLASTGKTKEYFLSIIEDEDDKKLFEQLCEDKSFMTAKSWFEHRDVIAKHAGAKNWATATDAQKKTAVQWFGTVKFRNGKAVPK